MENFTEKLLSVDTLRTIKWAEDPILKDYAFPAAIYAPFPGAVSKRVTAPGEYVSPAIVKALRLYALAVTGIGSSPYDIALAIDEDGITRAEYRYVLDASDPEVYADVAVYDPSKKKMMAGICTKNGKTVTPMTLIFDSKKKLNPCVPIILALLPNLMADSEFEEIYEQVKPALIAPAKADSDFYKGCGILTSNFAARSEDAKSTFGIKAETQIKIMKERQVTDAFTTVENEFNVGNFVFMGSAGFSARTMSAKAFNGKFKIGPCVDPDAMVMPDFYLVPQVIIDICEDIKDSTVLNVPVRNIMLLGPSGTGKSEGAKAIAAGLGVPYEAYTCHSKTDLFEIFGGYVPNTDEGGQDVDIPTPEDMEFDQEGSYERLTGQKLGNGKKTDIYELFSLAINKLKKTAPKSSANRYKFVESATTRAIKSDKYRVLEIQELDRIKDAGTITMLNEILCYGKAQLPNGQVIKRDRNTIIVFTANVNYAASRQMDQSIISRCEEVEWIELPDKAELVKRAMTRTGCTDKSLVEKMAAKVMEIQHYTEEQGITDGSCGFRELVSWITTVMLGRSYEKQAVRCVINKATLSNEDKKAIALACFDMEYDEMLHS